MAQWTRDAAQQDALITTAQLRKAGVRDDALPTLVANGWLRHERRGVYAIEGAPRTWRQSLHGAVLAIGNAVVSHSCAATFWEYRHLPYLTLEVTVGRTRSGRVPGVHAHHVTTMPEDDVTHRFGMPVTTFERTLIDCSTVLSPFQLLANLDDGLRRNVASVRALRECAERLHSGPGRRLSVIEWVLERRPNAYQPGGSHAERRILDVLVAAGLPAPVQQYRVQVDGKTYFLDYAYPDRRIFIEYYGNAWHGTPSAVVYDSERISALTSRQWLPLMFTEETPDRVIIQRVAAVLGIDRAA
jgi:hypothetical protein